MLRAVDWGMVILWIMWGTLWMGAVYGLALLGHWSRRR